MTDDDLTARYESLRAAAAEVVHRALITRDPAPYTPQLNALYRLLLEAQSPAAAAGSEPAPSAPDPARQSLAFRNHCDDGTSAPYGLAELAAEIRAELSEDRLPAEHVPGHPSRNVRMSQLRAMVIGSLLRELAARLVPGPAVGMSEEGRGLAAIAIENSKRLLNQTI